MGDDIACTHGAALEPCLLDVALSHCQLLTYHVGHRSVRPGQVAAVVLLLNAHIVQNVGNERPRHRSGDVYESEIDKRTIDVIGVYPVISFI